MTKKALVIGSGSLRGAYSAGVAATLNRALGPEYFDKVYACSVGVYMAAFFLAGQADVIEDTWRNKVSGKQLVNFLNLSRGRHVLDLEYLEDIFSQGASALDRERLLQNKTSLEICLTDSKTGEPIYRETKTEDLLRTMSASCAYPLLHPPVKINGRAYFDGGMSDPLPVRKAIDEGHEEIIAIHTKPEQLAVSLKRGARIFRKLVIPYLGFPPKIVEGINEYEKRRAAVEKDLQDFRVKVIRPAQKLPIRHLIDTNHARINESFDQGVNDAAIFLQTYAM